MIWQVQIGDGSNLFLLQIVPGASLKLAPGLVCTRRTACVTGGLWRVPELCIAYELLLKCIAETSLIKHFQLPASSMGKAKNVPAAWARFPFAWM